LSPGPGFKAPGSQIFRAKTCIFSDLGQSRWANLYAIMKTESEVRPPGAL
jgi:hypothetical protein